MTFLWDDTGLGHTWSEVGAFVNREGEGASRVIFLVD